jgi:hypothetical protein
MMSFDLLVLVPIVRWCATGAFITSIDIGRKLAFERTMRQITVE